MTTAVWRGTRDDLKEALRRTVSALAGNVPDSTNLIEGLQLRTAMVLLSKIQQAFIVKSRGGVGEDGISWPPLKKETIAYGRRKTKAEMRPYVQAGMTNRGLLTATQNEKWKKLFAKLKYHLMGKFGMGEQEASKIAAGHAWNVLKTEDGAKTMLEEFGNRQVDILRDTGELFASLSPGVSPQDQVDGQILRSGPGEFTVGTNKKPWHHKGVAGKLPARNLWPPDGNLPTAWWDAMLTHYKKGVLLVFVYVIQRGGM